MVCFKDVASCGLFQGLSSVYAACWPMPAKTNVWGLRLMTKSKFQCVCFHIVALHQKFFIRSLVHAKAVGHGFVVGFVLKGSQALISKSRKLSLVWHARAWQLAMERDRYHDR